MRILCILSLALAISFGTPSSAAVQIDISSTPTLPAENLIKNGDFENGLQSWGIAGKPEERANEGWKVEPTNEAYRGKSALCINVEPKASSRSRGAYQLLPKGTLSPGKSYVLSCRVKAGKPVSRIGGDYCGAGTGFSIFSADWKRSVEAFAKTGSTNDKWIRLVSQPLQCPEWGVIGQITPAVSYTSGEACIDDICLSEAFVDLSVRVTGGGISQVLVADETGKAIFESSTLPAGTKEFTKNISVLSAYKYKVTVLDDKGNISEQEYPAGSDK